LRVVAHDFPGRKNRAFERAMKYKNERGRKNGRVFHQTNAAAE